MKLTFRWDWNDRYFITLDAVLLEPDRVKSFVENAAELTKVFWQRRMLCGYAVREDAIQSLTESASRFGIEVVLLNGTERRTKRGLQSDIEYNLRFAECLVETARADMRELVKTFADTDDMVLAVRDLRSAYHKLQRDNSELTEEVVRLRKEAAQ